MMNTGLMKLLPLLLLLLLSRNALGQRYVITDFKVSGTKRYTSAEVARASGLKQAPETASIADVRAAAERLLETGVFSEVGFRHAPAGKKLAIQFLVKDAEGMVKCEFDNFPWFTRAGLLEVIQTEVPLFKGEVPVESSMADQVAQVLENNLHARNVAGKVAHYLSEDGAEKSVIFQIEGSELKVSKVDVAGVSAEMAPQVKQAAERLSGTEYAMERVKSFGESVLLGIYRRNGFLKAKLLAIEPQMDNAAPNKVAVVFRLEEGRSYTVAGLKFFGNETFPWQLITQGVDLPSGQPANLLKVNTAAQMMAAQYHSRGYVEASIRMIPKFDEPTSTVVYEVSVTEGAQYAMGEFDVAGLSERAAQDLKLAWKLREGEPYDKTYVKRYLGAAEKLIPREGYEMSVQETPDPRTHTVDTTLVFRAKPGK